MTLSKTDIPLEKNHLPKFKSHFLKPSNKKNRIRKISHHEKNIYHNKKKKNAQILKHKFVLKFQFSQKIYHIYQH